MSAIDELISSIPRSELPENFYKNYSNDLALETAAEYIDKLESENKRLREFKKELKERVAEHISVFAGKRGGKNYCAGLHAVLNFIKESENDQS